MTNQFSKKSSISHLDPLARRRICMKLNNRHSLGANYHALAAHFDMPNDDKMLISQNPNPTDTVLNWIQRKPNNTICQLGQALAEMRRNDCVMIIDENPSFSEVEIE